MLKCSNVFISLILTNILFYRKNLIEEKHLRYETQKLFIVQCIIEWAHIYKPDLTNNLFVVTQAEDIVLRSPEVVEWQ